MSAAATFDAFRDAVERHDHASIVATLAPDCRFCSPAVHQAYEGRDATAFVLAGVVQVLEDFRYVDDVRDGDRAVLRFTARVGDREVEGVDLLRAGPDGQITELTVMMRPLRGLQAVVEAMQEALARVKAAQEQGPAA